MPTTTGARPELFDVPTQVLPAVRPTPAPTSSRQVDPFGLALPVKAPRDWIGWFHSGVLIGLVSLLFLAPGVTPP